MGGKQRQIKALIEDASVRSRSWSTQRMGVMGAVYVEPVDLLFVLVVVNDLEGDSTGIYCIKDSLRRIGVDKLLGAVTQHCGGEAILDASRYSPLCLRGAASFNELLLQGVLLKLSQEAEVFECCREGIPDLAHNLAVSLVYS